jgi:hypothetical protein
MEYDDDEEMTKAPNLEGAELEGINISLKLKLIE